MHKNIELIRALLQTALEPQTLTIKDDSAKHAGHAGAIASGGGHYVIHIVSNQFEDQSAIMRHKMVYAALGDAMGSIIHAVSIKAQTPSEETTNR